MHPTSKHRSPERTLRFLSPDRKDANLSLIPQGHTVHNAWGQGELDQSHFAGLT